MAELTVLDAGFLRTRLDTAGLSLPSLMEVFSVEVSGLIDTLEGCHRCDDLDEIRRYAHKLKGMCLNMGADRLGEIGRLIEEEAMPGDIEALLKDARTVFQRTMDALQRMTEAET
jgi:HPt (histidine-containing phosphotransfer) domain-containing protein